MARESAASALAFGRIGGQRGARAESPATAAVGDGSPVFALSWLFGNAFVLTALPRLRRAAPAGGPLA